MYFRFVSRETISIQKQIIINSTKFILKFVNDLTKYWST